jgi:hypothetical protein
MVPRSSAPRLVLSHREPAQVMVEIAALLAHLAPLRRAQ